MKHQDFDWAQFESTGADWDIDCHSHNIPVKAYVVYSDSESNVLQECTIYAETVYPLSLMGAISGFRPEFTTAATITFEYVDGTISCTNYLKF